MRMMDLGSLFAGIAFSHARLGNVHAMSHPVSAYYDVPHGVANAIILPIVVEFNMKADAGKYYEIYKRIAAIPCSKEQFKSEKLISEIRRLIEELGIPMPSFDEIKPLDKAKHIMEKLHEHLVYSLI